MFLRRDDVAEIVDRALRVGVEQRRFELAAFAIMANHVHAVIRPKGDPVAVLQWLKGSTAREANLVLNRTGLPFWQRESYDRWVRDDSELKRIVSYVENNPVKAGLVGEAGSYRWCSAYERALKCPPAR
jgi:putative transposase